MDPKTSGLTLSLENRLESGRQIPPLPEDGMLVNLDNESKLHAWLLQGMTKTGRTHWNESLLPTFLPRQNICQASQPVSQLKIDLPHFVDWNRTWLSSKWIQLIKWAC